MNPGNLTAGAGRLQEAAEVLRAEWQRVCDVWQDENARRFEDEELQPLAQALQTALPAISQMASTLEAMRRELTDERLRRDDFL